MSDSKAAYVQLTMEDWVQVLYALDCFAVEACGEDGTLPKDDALNIGFRLREQLKAAAPTGGLIELQGGVTIEGKPFVVTMADGAPLGQLTPAEAINHGIRSIQAGIEAERDSALMRGLTANGATRQDAAAHLSMIRVFRAQVDPDPRSDVPEGPH